MYGIGAETIKGPIGRVIGIILILSVFALATGTINGWYLSAQDTGQFQYERYDRVVAADVSKTAEEVWQGVTAVVKSGAAGMDTSTTATTAYMLFNSSDACGVSGMASSGVTSTTMLTPIGTEVTLAADGTITGCEWEPASSVFVDSGLGGLINIILQAIGLAGPVLILTEVGNFGQSFMRRTGGHAVMGIIVMIVLLLFVGYMVNVFLPFLSDAHQSIDANRFAMYDSGLGRLSLVIGNFFGVVLVAGLLSLGWTLFQSTRSGNVFSSQRM